jgi:hypothetical protein
MTPRTGKIRGVRILLGSAASIVAIASCSNGSIGGSAPQSETNSSSGSSSQPNASGSSAAASGASPSASSGNSAVGSGSGATAPTDAAPTASMHLLTAAQFANSLQDLLGSGAPLTPVEPDDVVAGFAQVGASSLVVSPAGVGLFETAAGNATAWAFADMTHASAVLSCVPQTMSDTACATTGLSAFGRKAFRRPLTSDEVSRYVTLATTIASESGATVLDGLRHAVWGMLQSPNFLYRVELGVPSAADGGRLKYTSFEMASRLASALWNSVPDDPLLDAAAADQLATPAGVTTQVQRMMTDARAHRGLKAFVDDLYVMSNLAEATKDPTMFPAWTPTVLAEMQQELEARVDDIVFGEPGDYLSLYDSTTTFVNDDLATYYGLPTMGSTAFRKVQLPQSGPRVGLLAAGAILASNGLPQRTSPTLRGLFVDQSILCKTIPPPPPGVPPLPPTLGPNTTLRQQLTAHRAAPQCASCHQNMDPIGFGMEDFNTAGLYRTTDNGQPIDSTGTLDGVSFDGIAQLGTALRKDALSAPCFVTKVYTNAQGRAPTDWDNVPLQALGQQFSSSGNRADKLLASLVASDAFRFVQPAQM